jgi:colanic acid/amylovoran biosynthesis protein
MFGSRNDSNPQLRETNLQRKRILCPGGYTWSNKGDAALIICMLQELRRAVEGSEFILLTDTPELDSRNYSEKVLPMPFGKSNYGGTHTGALARMVEKYNRYIGWRWGGKLSVRLRSLPESMSTYTRTILSFCSFVIHATLACNLLRQKAYMLFGPKNRSTIQAFCEADAIVFVPGGYLLTPHARHLHWFRHIASLLLGSLLKKPMILYACSLGPFVGRHNQVLARYAINKAHVIVLREPHSRKYLSEIGVTKPVIYDCADVAFLLKQTDSRRATALFDAHIGSGSRLKVGFSVRPYDFPGESNPEQKKENFVKVLSQLADYVVDRYRAQAVFMPQGLDAKYNDLSISREIVGLMRQSHNVQVIGEDYSPEELKTLYGFMDIFVGVRMHANIFALGAKVPVLAVAYEPKTLGIMESLGLHEFVSDIRTLSFGELRDKMDALISNRSRIRNYLQSKVPAVELEAQRGAAITAAFLEKWFRSVRLG